MIKLRCPLHKRYKAKRRPRHIKHKYGSSVSIHTCICCQYIWDAVEAVEIAKLGEKR